VGDVIMASLKEIKSLRFQVYFDLIFGITSSVICLIDLTMAFIFNNVANMGSFMVSVIFWGGYLVFSLFLVGLGIYAWHKEKNLEKYGPKKGLKAPIL
jgi:hypothetical protein